MNGFERLEAHFSTLKIDHRSRPLTHRDQAHHYFQFGKTKNKCSNGIFFIAQNEQHLILGHFERNNSYFSSKRKKSQHDSAGLTI